MLLPIFFVVCREVSLLRGIACKEYKEAGYTYSCLNVVIRNPQKILVKVLKTAGQLGDLYVNVYGVGMGVCDSKMDFNI